MQNIDITKCGGFILEARIDGVKYGSGNDADCEIDLIHRRDGKPGLSGVPAPMGEPVLITDEVLMHLFPAGVGGLICTKPLTVRDGELRLMR